MCRDCYQRKFGASPEERAAAESRRKMEQAASAEKARKAEEQEMSARLSSRFAQLREAAPSGLPGIPEQVILTTAPLLEGFRVIRTLDVISAECVFGQNLFRDFFAAVTDLVGGRSAASQSVLRDARVSCMSELRHEAVRMGANAVIGVDLDYSEISGGDKSMLMLVATGTAVFAERADDEARGHATRA